MYYYNALSGIKIRKAIGPNMLPNRLLKEFADELALPIGTSINVAWVKVMFLTYQKSLRPRKLIPT